MKTFKQLCEKYSEKVYFWSIRGKKVIPATKDVQETDRLLTFPDGSVLTARTSKSEIYDFEWYASDGVRVDFRYFNDWTTPMNEVFMLFVKDFDNFEKTVDKAVTTYTHKVLGHTFSGSYNTYGSINWSSGVDSLSPDQLNKIYQLLELYKHNDRMVEFNKLNNLRKAKNEARKINKYLRTLK